MRVPISWLKELVEVKDINELVRLLPLRTIGLKEITDDFIELDMKGYNRADLLSMRGVAYEISAITDRPLKFSTIPQDFVWANKNLPETAVEIENHNLASVQCVAKIEGLKIEPSQKEWVKKLEDSGIRSIDNITDITNLVMLEFGQPLHAFDASKVKDEAIIVRVAEVGEEIETIDHKLRKLESTDIVLADSDKALDVAGIMGGRDTEVKNTTTTILLSASLFNPVMVRKTAQRLGLHSEASRRFQHGLSSIHTLQALDAAIRMYQNLGGKLTAINLVGKFETTERKLDLRISKTNSLLGVDLDEQTITGCLTKLNFVVEVKNVDTLEVTVPYYRLDINIEEDLIEEVARMFGYEKIPSQKLSGKLPEKIDQSLPNFIYDLKKALADAGLTEMQTYSFYSTDVMNNFSLDKDELIKVANPISSETEYLRDNLWPNLIEVVSKNLRQGYSNIAIFEVGKVYSQKEGELPKETYKLAIGLMNGTDNPTEELVSLYQGINLPHLQGVQIAQGEMMKELKALFHPTRFATIKSGEKVIGGVAEAHPRFLNNFGIEKRVAILEIGIESLV